MILRLPHATACQLGLLCLLLTACAVQFEPKPFEQVPFLERSISQQEEGITVTAAVPSAAETQDLFGVSLYRRGVQPVWIQVENSTAEQVSFLPVAVDAKYISPTEASSIYQSSKSRSEMEQHFFQNGIDRLVAPGETRAGYMFTHLDEGTKAFNVDIVGDGRAWNFTFFIPVPGLKLDHHAVDFAGMYSAEELEDFDDAGDFIKAVQQLPCCTTDATAKGSGDPLNLVVIGEPIDLYYAFIRAGWDETEAISTASSFKTIISFISGGAYRYSPVSSLYVFGRPQDVALQKIRQNINERNHLRLWLAPLRFEDKPVWIGQISRDIGVRFTKKTLTTHKIDPDVDETREFLLENLAYHQALAKFGYIAGVVAAPIDEPRGNLTGDPYFTDGLRVVLWVSSDSVDFAEIDSVEWERPRG